MTHITDDYEQIFKTVLQLRVLSTTLKKVFFCSKHVFLMLTGLLSFFPETSFNADVLVFIQNFCYNF